MAKVETTVPLPTGRVTGFPVVASEGELRTMRRTGSEPMGEPSLEDDRSSPDRSSPMQTGNRTEVIAQLCRHCDLAERLPLVPPSAKVRGLYFRSIERVLATAGKRDQYDELFPQRFATVLWHPLAEFLVRLGVGAALLAGAEEVERGMFEIGRANAVAFAESLLGRTLLRLLDRDPKRVLRQGIAGRRQSCNFGRWELELGERQAIVTMAEDYTYIESYLLGAARGTFDAIGLPVHAEAILRDRFNGQHILRW
jgi:uncharacterized protein (TIGR02265 family)